MASPSRPTDRVLRVALEGLAAGERTLDGDSAHYVGRVHRLVAGDAFVAFDPAARLEADATVLEVGRREVRCRIAAPRSARLLGLSGVSLLVCATKGDKLEDVIRGVTALGASAVSVVESARSVPELGASADKRFARYRSVAVDAARQSGRGDLPELGGPMSLEEALQGLSGSSDAKLCLDPLAERSLVGVLAEQGERPLVLLVGPEGGLAPEELVDAERAGFERVGLGRLVLRAELAAIAAVSVVVAHRSSTQNPDTQ
jgi:16S rRNA (uracil1498-N3)-methyltransferase